MSTLSNSCFAICFGIGNNCLLCGSFRGAGAIDQFCAAHCACARVRLLRVGAAVCAYGTARLGLRKHGMEGVRERVAVTV